MRRDQHKHNKSGKQVHVLKGGECCGGKEKCCEKGQGGWASGGMATVLTS